MNPLVAALVAMRRSPYQSLAAILMTSITFLVIYIFSLFLFGTETVLQYFETRPQIIAFFELTADPAVISNLEQTMRQKPYVADVKVVSKEKALEMYRADNKDDPLLLELVTAEILPASIEVSGKQLEDLDQIKQDLDQAKDIDEVVFQQDLVTTMTRYTNSIRLIGLGSIALLSLTSFLIIFVIIGMKVTTKRQIIQIMRMIGATKMYIALPFFYEGSLYGLVGSVIGWAAMYGSLLYATPWLKEFLGTVPLLPVPWPILAIQFSAGTLLGMLLGGITGIMAVRRLIRM